MKNRSFFILILFFMSIFRLWGVNFTGLTVSNDDRLLFRADFLSQHALFITNLNDMSIQQLTAAAEKLYLVENGRTIIALNRFGASRINITGGLPSPLIGYPSFERGNTPLKGRLQDIAISADGNRFVYIEPISAGYGNLILVDRSGAKRVITSRIELPGSEFPVKWSPDSRLFVYEKGGRLFYFPILSDITVLVDERFRMIGSGTINSVAWGRNGNFFYFTGNVLYQVINPELFTRTIYGDFLSIGRVAAVLPFNFDPRFDKYWVAPDSGSLLINKGSRSVFLYKLGDNQNTSGAFAGDFLPQVPIPYGAGNFNILWTENSAAVSFSVQNETTLIKFSNIKENINIRTFRRISLLYNIALSPDGTKLVLWGENGLELFDYEHVTPIQALSREPVFSCAWLNNRQIIVGNQRWIEEINITSSAYPRRRICLSSASEFGFEESAGNSSRILAKAGNDWFASNGTNAWVPVSNVQLRQTSLSSDRFRVFLQPQGASGHYRNIPMIRSMQSTGTLSLVSRHIANNSYNTSRPVQIALCFDLYDDDTGLLQVLSALKRHNINATFFLNGEFIRRNPAGVSLILNSGHEAGNMFYSPIDHSDTRYSITQEFIARGLARNEDEFHRATGRELFILWHPPFYRSSSFVNAAAAAAGYTTIERTIDPGDYISREDALRMNLRQVPPAEMIEQILRRRENGAVVPIRLGLLPGGRDEYLFQRIDVLLDALLRSGFEIVPVSSSIR